ncbi:MAG: hypothetical protein D6698_13095 [Gammaproteobacteria bacterium]|nr:MAG: hypothetical protein D6698_13095 [Gammaproteobacteria bacterium]
MIFEVKLPGNWDEVIVNTKSRYRSEERVDNQPRNLAQTIETLERTVRLSYNDISRKRAEAIAWACIGLLDIYALLLDEGVNEIIASRIGEPLVVTHSKYGRCLTNLRLGTNLWNALKNRAEFDTGEALTPLTPALKAGFETDIGSIRLSMQTTPLAPDGPTFTIRRLPKKSFTLTDLISQNQIKEQEGRFLLHQLARRANIIIAGEPGSGKTTLANALLKESEKSWRLIVIEDAREIRFESKEFPLLTRYSMPAVGSDSRARNRAEEIARMLHRSPDYVFLGEIQNKDDTKAALEAFAAGIRGMATTHGRDIDGLIARWELSHGLSHDLLRVIDIVVMTRREIIDGRSKLSVDAIYRSMKDGKKFLGFKEVSP